MKDGITYEQCPWNVDHIYAIYPILGDVVDVDGAWHDFPPRQNGFGKYRVYNREYFQAIFSERLCSL